MAADGTVLGRSRAATPAPDPGGRGVSEVVAQVLDRLRPDVWAKGGDYSGTDLPEAAALAAWGGQAVLLPYLDGRSTSGLVTRIAALHQQG